MTKFYVDISGNYLGAFDGAVPPVGSTEVGTPPADARLIWNGSAWTQPAAVKALIVKDKRAAAYPPIGDQLDFITKVFAYLVSKGIDLGPDGSAYIAAINNVKSQIN